MGCVSSAEATGKAQSDAIDMQLRRDAQRSSKEVKLLLLGAGESGKSTILKQMQLIHGVGYSDHDRQAYKEIIFSNVVLSTFALYMGCTDRLGMRLAGGPASERAAAALVQAHETNRVADLETFPADLAQAVATLWNDRSMQAAYARSAEFQLNDSAKYYFTQLERISQPNYIPTDQDILRSRVKTTGITESVFQLGDLTYRMFDVGGQRSERKKWIHCFEDVTAIVFLVAISEYDQVLLEDESVNRMHESLALFDSICNSRWFEQTSMILFLNKIDLFKSKLQYSPIRRCFPDFNGVEGDFDSACEYFLTRFVSLNRSPNKQVYCHFTCATDTSQIRFVMASVNDCIIQQNLRRVGLM
ncbi:G protein alpha subunit [Catenaria anguillulae PL171]|uniref:Guanine nucleotide-binding protein alpha-16 subunit n=1 Tax=Catenaria anguillulae PL171 TaxID=765915 RepID=A0A1Y2HMQ5_9FUNG|nr:G protein alpha subunit [Catenaria anguillulae PL171]